MKSIRIASLATAVAIASCAAPSATDPDSPESESKFNVGLEPENLAVPILVVEDRHRPQLSLFCWYALHADKTPNDFYTRRGFAEYVRRKMQQSAYRTLSTQGAISLATLRETMEIASDQSLKHMAGSVVFSVISATAGGRLARGGAHLVQMVGWALGAGSFSVATAGSGTSIRFWMVRDLQDELEGENPLYEWPLPLNVFSDLVSSVPSQETSAPERAGFCASYARRFILQEGADLD